MYRRVYGRWGVRNLWQWSLTHPEQARGIVITDIFRSR